VFERAIAKDGPRTRQDLRHALTTDGIETDTGRLAHLIIWAEAEAVLCSGPRRGAAHTYALVDERVLAAPARQGDEALSEIAARYVASHGPAQDLDLAWWSGLTVGEARRGLAAAAPALSFEVIDGRRFWFSDGESAPAADRAIHLLPNFDEYLVAFRDRRDALHPDLPSWARTAEEIFSHVLVRHGLVGGAWERPAGTRAAMIRIESRVPLDSADRQAVEAAVGRYARFLGRPGEVAGLDWGWGRARAILRLAVGPLRPGGLAGPR
jgi:hypothetical protein